MTRLRDVVVGVALTRVLDRVGAGGPAPPRGARHAAVAPAEERRPGDAAASEGVPRSTPLFALMLVSFAVGAVLMLIFDSAPTRVVGVLALFAFIVAGVFLVAHPAFLEREDEGDA